MSINTRTGLALALHLDLHIKIVDPTLIGGLLQKPGSSLVSATVKGTHLLIAGSEEEC